MGKFLQTTRIINSCCFDKFDRISKLNKRTCFYKGNDSALFSVTKSHNLNRLKFTTPSSSKWVVECFKPRNWKILKHHHAVTDFLLHMWRTCNAAKNQNRETWTHFIFDTSEEKYQMYKKDNLNQIFFKIVINWDKNVETSFYSSTMKMINHLVKNNAAVGQFVLQGWVIVIFYVL